MNSIVKAIFNEFASSLIEKYNIDVTPGELYVMWRQTIKSMTVSTSFNKPEAETASEDEAKIEKVPEEKKEVAKKSKAPAAPAKACPYKPSKGANAGNECGKNAAKDSIMCSAHKKYADKYEKVDSDEEEEAAAKLKAKLTKKADEKEPELKPVSKSDAKGCSYVFSRGSKKDQRCGAAQVKETDFCSKHQKSPVEKGGKSAPVPKAKAAEKASVTDKAAEKLVCVNDGTHFVMRGPRPLVCKSPSEKVMIGKKIDGVVLPLDDDDIEYCKSMKFRYEVAAKKTLEDLLDEVQGVDDEKVEEDEDIVEDEVEEEEEEELLEDEE